MKIGKLTIDYQRSYDKETLIAFEPGCLSFRCNICGQACLVKVADLFNRRVPQGEA
jgi:hypothetical protein